jgi:hypothetical protein
LNWYRNVDRNWELMAPFAGAKVEIPALFMTGDKDLVYKFPVAAPYRRIGLTPRRQQGD